jgi:hypothetical protein
VSGVDLVQWLGEQLDEDERIARAATAGPWRAHDTHLGQYGYAATVLSGEGNDTDLRAWLPSMSNEPWDEARNVWADAEHVAAWGPARVLREIGAKRAVVAAYLPPGEDPHPGLPCVNYEGQDPAGYDEYDSCWQHLEASKKLIHHDYVLRLLAVVYEDRPGYQEAWRP